MLNLNSLTPITLAKLYNSIENVYKVSDGIEKAIILLYMLEICDAGDINCGEFEFNCLVVKDRNGVLK